MSMTGTSATYWPAGPKGPSEVLNWHLDVHLDDRWAVRRLGLDLPDVAADLLEVASVIHAVDRLVPRAAWRRGAQWHRQMYVQIPVRDPGLWHAAGHEMAELLHWLTDDDWSVQFTAGQGPLTDLQGSLLSAPPPDADVLLFSGGLDSTAGLAQHLDRGVRDVVTVSVYTNPLMHARQRQIIEVLGRAAHHRALPVQYQVSLGRQGQESSQRSRGFLFLAAGIATSWALGRDRLWVHENGIGAINLPYLRSQVGSQATRAVHPRTVIMMERLARRLSGRRFTISIPELAGTKAELVRSSPPSADEALRLSVSCDQGFATRMPGKLPCGACTSCLLRRQSLATAGRSDLDNAARYRIREPVGRDRDPLSAMRWQLVRLRRCFEGLDPWHALVAEFPQVVCAVPRIAPDALTHLYRTYTDEWKDLAPLLDTAWHADVSACEESRASAL